MPKLHNTPLEDEDQWLMAIGRVIWCMGQLEYLTYEWCLHLGGEGLRDDAIHKNGFRSRYDLVVAAVRDTNWPAAKKQEAFKLWRKAKCFAGFRNKIAHAPVISVRGS